MKKEIRNLYLIRAGDIMHNISCLDLPDDIMIEFNIKFFDNMTLLSINISPILLKIEFQIYEPSAVYVKIYHQKSICYENNLDSEGDGIDDYSDIEKYINDYWKGEKKWIKKN